jgi:hypothetical protein
MNTTGSRRWATSALVLGLLTACGGLEVARMLPPTAPAPVPRFAGVLRVMPVTGAKTAQFGGPALVSNEMFREALVAALRRSNLFRGVETEARADWELHADFLAHGQGVGLDYRAAMVVQYRIVQQRSGTEIWRQGINSRHEVTVSQAFSGATRTIMANEGSVRENLTQLIALMNTAALVP